MHYLKKEEKSIDFFPFLLILRVNDKCNAFLSRTSLKTKLILHTAHRDTLNKHTRTFYIDQANAFQNKIFQLVGYLIIIERMFN